MSGEVTIELKGLHFFAFHGLYAEERKTGNEFEVNLAISYQPSSGIITDISDTVNYAVLFELLKSEIQKPRDLLETLVMEITEIIHLSFPQIKKVKISVIKLYPPIPAFAGSVGVKYNKEY